MRRNLPRGARILGALLPALLSLPGSGESLPRSATRASVRSSVDAPTARSLRILADRPVRPTAAARTAAGTTDVATAAHTSALGTYEYAPIAIEPLAGQAESRAYGLNNAGQVAGRSFNYDAVNQKPLDRRAFVWDPLRGTRSLPTLSGESGVWGLSNSGQASGFSYTAAGRSHAVRWNTAPTPATIADLGTLTNTTTLQAGPTSTAYDLNDHGDVTGYADIPNDAGDFTPFHAILYTDAGGLQDLGTFDTVNPYYQYGYSISYSANTDGQVVGLADTSGWLFRPFIYDAAGGMRQLQIDPAYPTGEWYAVAINDGGMIGGHVIAPSGQSLPYYWTSETAPPVAVSMPTSFPYGEIYGTNAEGVMVGVMWNDAQEEHAFVFDTLTGVRDLNTLIDPALGWTLQFARDINATGQISGSGMVNGLVRGFLLTPSALMGALEGSVLHSGTGNALAGVQVKAYNAAGTQVAQVSTDAQGRYTISPLLPGTYFAIATNTLGGTDQLYAGRSCSACDPTSGSPIAVVASVTTPGINFSLGPPPTLSINDVTVTEGNSGTTIAQFSVTLSPASSSTVTVSFATVNGTATAGTDYVAQSGNLSFTAGQTSKTISVTVNGDTAVEPNETFLVNLSSPAGATLADGQGRGTITNDDVAPPAGEAVSWVNVVGASPSAGSLTKTAATAWGNAGAASSRAVNGNGQVEFTLPATPGYVMFGLSNGDSDQGYADIDFALCPYPGAGRILVYEKGTYRGQFGPYASGDTLRVAVASGVVKYYRNGALLYTSLQAPVLPLRVDTSLYSTGVVVSNAVLSGTLVDVSSLPSEAVTWVNAVGASVSGATLTKTAATGWTNAGAASSRAVNGDGYAEFTLPASSSYAMFGLSNGDTDQAYADIDHAFYTYPGTGQLMVYEKGVHRGQFGAYAAGDKLRVSVESGVVKYWWKGVLVYTSGQAPTLPLRVDTSLYSTGAVVQGATLAGTLVDLPLPTEAVVWQKAVGVSSTTTTLTKTAVTAWGNAGASSTRGISSGSGYAEFTVPASPGYAMFGLSNDDTDQGYADVDYAFYTYPGTGQLMVYEKGVYRAWLGAYTAGDKLRVSVDSGVVKYWWKGVLVNTSSQAPTFPLRVDTSLYSTGVVVQSATLGGANVATP